MEVVDRRQFIIAKRAYKFSRFNSINLKNGMVLSYDKDLRVQQGLYGILLGHAFSCMNNRIDLNNQYVVEERYQWSGRWVLITDDRLYLDATGNLGCYYYQMDGEIILSSSLHLLQQIVDTKWIADYQIRYNDGKPYQDFYPIPYTPFENIFKILPSQFYSFRTNRVEYYTFDVCFERFSNMSIAELYEKLKEYLDNIFIEIGKQYHSNVWIPLTGGVDSRTNLAVAVHNNLSFKTFTTIRENTRLWDYLAPKLLSRRIGCKHLNFDNRGTLDEQKEHAFNIHCGNIGGEVTVGTCKQQISKGTDVPNAQKAIILWGTGWEIYRRNMWWILPLCETNEERFSCWSSYSKGVCEVSNIHSKSIKKWLKDIEEHPFDSMDWRQRMYYDQRLGSWLSGLSQAYDMLDSTWICPVNCGYVIGVLINLVDKTFGKNARSDKRYQIQLINEYLPKAKKIPYELEEIFLYRVIRKINRSFQRRKSN